MAVVIRTRGLGFRYPGQGEPALADLDLDLAPGAVLVSGPTGSGKSTLGLILAGVIPHLVPGELTGRVEVAGLEPCRVPLRRLSRRVGLLLQNVDLQMVTDRVEDEVAFGLENLAVPPPEMPRHLRPALERVGAAGLAGRTLLSLSAGERQRVMLAALLVLGQEVLILDEPLAYLDRQGSAALTEILSSITQRGTTCLILEHRRHLLAPVITAEVCLSRGWRVPKPVPHVLPPPLPEAAFSGPPLLSFTEVSFGWPRHPLLFRGLSLEIYPGRSLVLLGNNGAGKTTLLKLAVGLLAPRQGMVSGPEVPDRRRCRRPGGREVALVPQNPDHQLRLPTVAQEVAWGAAGPEAAAKEMAALGLAGLEGRHPHSLSSGQKRRVTLAAALARRPQVLLLDEPTVGQDDASLARVLSRLKEFVRQGGALVTATHDVRAARVLAQEVLLLQNGRRVSGGPELLKEYFSPEEVEPAKISPPFCHKS